jgi:hypothetical protein
MEIPMRSYLLLSVPLALAVACNGSKEDSATAGTTDGTTSGTTDTDTNDPGDSGEPDGPDFPSGDPTGCDLTGKAFQLDFGDARVIQPAALGPILADSISDSLAFGVTAQTDSTVSTILVLNEGGTQDMCTPSAQPPEGTWNDPVFAVGPADLAVDVDGSAVTLSSFQFTAAATADCSSIEGGVFQTDLDTRLLGDVLGGLVGTEDPQGICDALLGFGAACEACDSDSEPYCLKLVIDHMNAGPYGSSLVEVTAEDIAANPDCGG